MTSKDLWTMCHLPLIVSSGRWCHREDIHNTLDYQLEERRQDMANKGDEEWLCETWESSRYNREGRRWTAEHWLHGCNASLAEIWTCFHFVATCLATLSKSRSPTTGTIFAIRAERQNIVSLSIPLVLYYHDNMSLFLVQSQNFNSLASFC